MARRRSSYESDVKSWNLTGPSRENPFLTEAIHRPARPTVGFSRPESIPNQRRPTVGTGRGLRHEHALENENRFWNRQAPLPVSLTARRITRALFCCAVLGALAVAHVQLRFLINDTRLQQQQVQRAHWELLQDYALLERTYASLTNYDRLHEYATEQLHMVEVENRPVAYISKDLKQKYTEGAIAQAVSSGSNRAIADRVTNLKTAASAHLLKLVDTGRALAAQAVP
jgi:cell division protein FtsL